MRNCRRRGAVWRPCSHRRKGERETGTIRVHGPEYLTEFIRPIPGDWYGIQRLAYMGSGEYLLPMMTPTHIDPREVATVLREMQTVIPLGFMGDFEFLCLGHQLLGSQDPVDSADGVQRPLYIALSGNLSNPLRDIVGHEVAHRLEGVLITQAERDGLFARLGFSVGSNFDPVWSRRPQEWLAEWLSLALWGCPMNETMTQLTPEQVAYVRSWAMEQVGAGQPATIIADGECISLTIGSPVMDVYGTPVELDSPPILINSRTMVPIRAISEALGRRVEWDQETWTVRIF